MSVVNQQTLGYVEKRYFIGLCQQLENVPKRKGGIFPPGLIMQSGPFFMPQNKKEVKPYGERHAK